MKTKEQILDKELTSLIGKKNLTQWKKNIEPEMYGSILDAMELYAKQQAINFTKETIIGLHYNGVKIFKGSPTKNELNKIYLKQKL